MSLLCVKIEFENQQKIKNQQKFKNKEKQTIVDNYYKDYNNYVFDNTKREKSITWNSVKYIYIYDKRSFSV